MNPGDYLGAKGGSGVRQQIIAAMPPHDTYIELFFGTGKIMWAKPRAPREIAVEIDAETLAAFPPPPHAEVIHGSALDFLRSFDFASAGRVLIYADPPYLLSTRRSRHRYRHELGTAAEHRELLQLLANLPPNVAVMISGYASDLYAELLADWRSLTYQTKTRGCVRTEWLWMNYPADRGAHWATHAGKDYIERQRIKRKAATWARRFAACPPGERLAILAAMLGEEIVEPAGIE